MSIYENVMAAGVVGAGGAGFPTHVKLSSRVDTVIANGAECEPVLETDRHIMLREGAKVVRGLRLAMESVGASTGIIAVKNKHEDVISIFERLLSGQKAIRLSLLDNFYPAGDEHVLVYETTGRIVPAGGIPLDVNVVVNNVFTLALIADAADGLPFTHRYVTVTGEVENPGVANIPVGISIRNAIYGISGRPLINDFKVVVGGAMMGYIEDDLEKPVTKTTGALIVLPPDHKVVAIKSLDLETAMKRAKSVCCQCNQCTDMCPRYLLGHKLRPSRMMRTMTSMFKVQDDLESVYEASLCSECGLCACYACTMGLNPSLVNRHYKSVLNKNGIKVNHGKVPIYEPNSSRQNLKTPTNRLIDRLGLTKYNRHLPFFTDEFRSTKLVLPLKQHIGVPSVPVVKVGDRVSAGQLIAAIPAGSMGANLHAPLNGYVTEIGQNIVINC